MHAFQPAVVHVEPVAVLNEVMRGPKHAAAVVAQRSVGQGGPAGGTLPNATVVAAGKLPVDGLLADVVATEQADGPIPNFVGHQFHELLIVRVFPVGSTMTSG